MYSATVASGQGHFTVDEQKFDITNTEMIEGLIGTKAMSFQASDMQKNDISTAPYLEQTVILFWNTQCQSCLGLIDGLTTFNASKPSNVSLITMADEPRAELEPFIESNAIAFPVIPQSKLLGEAAFADELGYPRVFIVGKDGLVQKIFSAEMLEQNTVPIDQFLLGELEN